MKTILSAVTLSAAFVLTAGTVPVDDFEQGKIDGWGGYKDKESAAPVLTLSDDAVSGDAALKIEFGGCKQYQGVFYQKAPAMPKEAVGVSFLIKPASGLPPGAFVLSEQDKRYGKDVATGLVPLNLTGNDWQKVTLKFDDFKYGSGPERGKKFPVKAGAIYVFRFYGPVTAQPSVFLIDDIAWETE